MSEREDLESVGGLHRLPLDISQTGTTELAEIVVFSDGRSETAGILKFAGVLAEDHDAHLIAVFIQPEPKVAAAETFALGGARSQLSRQQPGALRPHTHSLVEHKPIAN